MTDRLGQQNNFTSFSFHDPGGCIKEGGRGREREGGKGREVEGGRERGGGKDGILEAMG